MEVPPPVSPSRGDLAIRAISALVLIPFALFVVYQGGLWLAVGAAVFAGAMGFEWCRMSAHSPLWLAVAGLALANLAFAFVSGAIALGLLCAFAIVFAVLDWRAAPARAFGMLYSGGMPLALQALREGPDWNGLAAALILMAIVWASDTGAYFAGKGFGGPGLTPDSPNKTWSGAFGGVICTTISGVIAAGLLNASILAWIVFGALISVVAQYGDLFESQMKRRFGVKDASGILPGHGGIMDRVDGLGAVCVLAVLAFLAFPPLTHALGL